MIDDQSLIMCIALGRKSNWSPFLSVPSPWLQVTEAMKKKNMEKPYDGKKSAWVPDKANGGYLEGLCENDMKVADWEAVGKKVNVVVNGKTSAKFSNKN